MFELLLPSLLAGIGIASMSGFLGSFVLWRKMAYFGDTLSHASIMGIALGFVLQINLYLALIICCIFVATILIVLQKQKLIAIDTLLGILAYSSLSIGLISVSFIDDLRVDLMSYLFGDLLAISMNDLLFIYIGVTIVGLVLFFFWRPLLSSTVSENLAIIEGVNTSLMRIIIMLLIGLVIAVGMQFVGALIITSLLIIPAASARKIAKTPEQMACIAAIIGAIAIILGLSLSWHFDTPAGPSVVVMATAMFIISQFIPRRQY